MTEQLLEVAMKNHGNTVLRVAYSILGNRHDAEDVFNDVFFALWQYKKEFAGENHLKAWLIRVTLNKAKNVKKQAFNRYNTQLDDNIIAPEIDGQNGDVLQALKKLKLKARAVVYLHYYEGYNYTEIAKMLKQSEGNIRIIALRTREQLKELLR